MSNLVTLAAISISILTIWFVVAIYSVRPDATEPETAPSESTHVQSGPIHGNDRAVNAWTDPNPEQDQILRFETFVFQEDNGATVIMPNAEFAIRSLRASDLLTSVIETLGYDPGAMAGQ